MKDEETIGPVIGIVLILAIIFFGGLFVFFGRDRQENETPIEIPANEETLEENAAVSELIFETEPTEDVSAE